MSLFPSTKTRALAFGGLAATLLVAAGVAVWAGPGSTTSPSSKAVATGERAGGEVAAAAPDATATEPSTTVAPDTTVPSPSTTVAPATTVPRSTSRATTPTTAAKAAPSAPATTAPPAAAPVTPKLPPGQRLNPTSAQVQAAITTLHQRIPLFEPTEPQLRTFADAACTSFDQGQSFTQVQNTVRQAVTYIQGASLTQADAEFAVRTVVQLRCPGYLP